MRHLLTSVVPVLVLSTTALSQWQVVLLHPPGASESWVHGAEGGRQFGKVWRPSAMPGVVDAAVVWSGTVGSAVILAPAGAARSIAFDSGGHGGPVFGFAGSDHGPTAPGKWDGGASTWVDMSPVGAASGAIYAADASVQGGWVRFPGASGHAALWRGNADNWVDLHPDWAVSSMVLAVSGDRQAGELWFGGSMPHACVWTGTAQSCVDLHPSGAVLSSAQAAHGDRQGGYVHTGGSTRGGFWTGTAASWVDLTPAGAHSSTVTGVFEEFQVGQVGYPEVTFACVWSGSPSSCENLSVFLPAGYSAAQATCISADERNIYIGGVANNNALQRAEAVLWIKPRTAPPCGPADLAGDGAAIGPDGRLDNNDFIIFVSSFFVQSPTADRGSDGAVEGADGRFDNNDFIVFINQFFTGC